MIHLSCRNSPAAESSNLSGAGPAGRRKPRRPRGRSVSEGGAPHDKPAGRRGGREGPGRARPGRAGPGAEGTEPPGVKEREPEAERREGGAAD